MLKEIQAEAMRFVATFVMFLCVAFMANVAGAEGANENYVRVEGDKYVAGDITTYYTTPTTDIPASADAIVGGLIASETPSSIVAGGQASSGGAANNHITVSGGTVNKKCYGAMVGLAGMDATVSTEDAINNNVSVQNGTVVENVYGGYTNGTGNASTNSVYVSLDSRDSYNGSVTGNIYGGYAAGNGNAETNSLTILGDVHGDVHGGYTDGTGNASTNNVYVWNSSNPYLSNGSVTGNIYGGYAAGNGNAETNSLMIMGDVHGDVHGGYTDGTGKASSNYVLVENINYNSTYNLNGNEYNSSTYWNGNVTGNIYGGYAASSGNAESNYSFISGKVDGNVYGGYTEGTGNASSNITSVYSMNYSNNNNYTLDGQKYNSSSTASIIGNVTGNIYGGYAAGSGSANNNLVYFDSSLDNYHTSTTDSNGNTYTSNYSYAPINVGGDIYGGYAANNGTANNNNIYLYGKVDLGSSNIYGGYSANGTTEGNTLTVLGTGNKVKSINNFQKMHFILSLAKLNESSLEGLTDEQKASVRESYESFRATHAVNNGDTMLTAETANIQGTSIAGYVSGDTDLTEGDKITLIDATTLNTDGNTTFNGYLAEGVSFNHKLNVMRDGNKIVATIDNGSTPTTTDIPEISTDPTTMSNTPTNPTNPTNPVTPTPVPPTPELLEQTAVLPAPAVIAPKILLTHIDNTLSWLPSEDFAAPSSFNSSANSSNNESKAEGETTKDLGMDKQAEKPGYEIFGNFGASSIRTNTGNGSHVDSKTTGINLGFARRFDGEHSRTYVAPLFDYGGGSYDSYLPNGIHGKGNTHFIAGGVIARHTMDNGFYYEGSFRIGKTTMDFKSDDLMQNDEKVHTAYNSNARVWAAHLHLGRRIEFSPSDVLQLYGIYFHAHQSSFGAKLNTGETYNFGSVTDKKLRVGARLLKWAKPTSCFYSGIAYQWESAGAANATYKDKTTNNMGAAGSSVMLELGWQVKPEKESRIAFDIGAVGWLGHQRGASAHIKFNYAF